MKAWEVWGQGEPASVLRLDEDRARPEPGPGEVLVRVAAAGLGLPDVFMCRGTYAFSPPQPFVPGQEVAGTVVAAGEGSAWSPGQRVCGVTAFYRGHGGFAEYCLALDHALYPVPDGLDDPAAAAFCIPYHTAAVGLVLRAALQPGEVLLVHGGAGGSGQAAIRLGRALGATVIAAAGGAEHVAWCRESGAHHALDHRAVDLPAEVLALTGGRGADVVFDPVGGETFEGSLACTASGGRLLAVGYACGRWGQLDSRELVLRNCAALGVFVGAHSRDEMLAQHGALCELLRDGRLAPPEPIGVAFGNIPGALSDLAARRMRGKAVAVPG